MVFRRLDWLAVRYRLGGESPLVPHPPSRLVAQGLATRHRLDAALYPLRPLMAPPSDALQRVGTVQMLLPHEQPPRSGFAVRQRPPGAGK